MPVAHRREAALRSFQQGSLQELEALCQTELQDSPVIDAFALLHLAIIRSQQGRPAEAEDLLRHGAELFPNHVEMQRLWAKQLSLMGRYEATLLPLTRVIELAPGDLAALLAKAEAMAHLGRGADAEQLARLAIQLAPSEPAAWRNLIKGLFLQGKVSEAVEACHRAIELDPDSDTFRIGLVFAMIYDEHSKPEDLLAISREFGRRMEARAAVHLRPYRNAPLVNRRLRIGFLSPDLRNHSVMYFAEPLIAGLSRQDFEVFCYLTHPKPDAVTERVRCLSDRFRILSTKEPKQAADQIREDEVDVLIDLAGHTGYSGLPIMAYRPAPVQATWLGYPATTGLTTVEWRITDHFGDPPGSDRYYTEKLARLPGCFAVYRPHIRNHFQRFDEQYEVSSLPALRMGAVTFGSCNNLAKISDHCISAWSRVLLTVPQSRLLIEGKDLDREAARHRLREQFRRNGISEERIVYVGRDPTRQYLTYRDIDIALDSFPLTGGTTTFDALWMGVPVVTLVGKSYRERLSGTILAGGGFTDTLCETVDAYVARAASLANDLADLAKRRSEQRLRMQESPLMNEPAFCQKFGTALQLIWARWCSQQDLTDAQVPATKGVKVSCPASEDALLVPVNGARVTLRNARAWLGELRKGLHVNRSMDNVESARALALAILWVCPNDALAAEVAHVTSDWTPDNVGPEVDDQATAESQPWVSA
jgi:protein O-GlcNAc transferase